MGIDRSAEPLVVHLLVLAEVGHGEDGEADGRHQLLLQEIDPVPLLVKLALKVTHLWCGTHTYMVIIV